MSLKLCYSNKYTPSQSVMQLDFLFINMYCLYQAILAQSRDKVETFLEMKMFSEKLHAPLRPLLRREDLNWFVPTCTTSHDLLALWLVGPIVLFSWQLHTEFLFSVALGFTIFTVLVYGSIKWYLLDLEPALKYESTTWELNLTVISLLLWPLSILLWTTYQGFRPFIKALLQPPQQR